MGRHAVLEADRPPVPTAAVPSTFVPFPIPTQRAPAPVVHPAPRAAAPVLPAPVVPVTGFPRPAWVPPGYDAPPAGLDGPLDGPPVAWTPPRGSAVMPVAAPRRTTVAAVVGSAAAGIALLATGGTALATLAHTTAVTATPAPTSAASTTAEQCSDAVADQLDDTASALAQGPRTTWSSTVASHTRSVAGTYGTGSAEYAAYTAGASEILDWLRDPTATETYANVVDRIVPAVVATCDRAYG